jgi:hypothetical protein
MDSPEAVAAAVVEDLYNLEGFESEEEVQQYLDLKQSNHDRLKKLVDQGMRLHPMQVVTLQFDTLISVLGYEVGAAWGVEFETRMAAVLGEMEKELPRLKLLQGVQGQPDVHKLLQK